MRNLCYRALLAEYPVSGAGAGREVVEGVGSDPADRAAGPEVTRGRVGVEYPATDWARRGWVCQARERH